MKTFVAKQPSRVNIKNPNWARVEVYEKPDNVMVFFSESGATAIRIIDAKLQEHFFTLQSADVEVDGGEGRFID